MGKNLSESEKIHLNVALNTKKDFTNGASEEEEKIRKSLLNFYLTFNIFESFYFEKPQWENVQLNGSSTVKKRKKAKTVYKRHSDIQKFCNKKNYPLTAKKDNPSFINVRAIQDHFRDAYLEKINGKYELNQRGKTLELSDENPNGLTPDSINQLKEFLTANLTIKENKEDAIRNALYLCYFFRNNLFHGSKEITELKDFVEDFDKISNFLTGLMRYLQANNASRF